MHLCSVYFGIQSFGAIVDIVDGKRTTFTHGMGKHAAIVVAVLEVHARVEKMALASGRQSRRERW